VDSPGSLERLLQEIGKSKYRDVEPGLIRGILAQQLQRYPSEKLAVKATKRKLHALWDCFAASPANYRQWIAELREGQINTEELPSWAQGLLAKHQSTRERLPLLSEFYEQILPPLQPVNSVIDVGCGLHPLGIAWMGLGATTEYTAYDIDLPLIALLNEFFAMAPIHGRALAVNVLDDIAYPNVDVAFVLKLLPLLDQLESKGGLRLLQKLPTPILIVSFPRFSLGQRKPLTIYEKNFAKLIDQEGWRAEKLEFSTELVFRVRKS